MKVNITVVAAILALLTTTLQAEAQHIRVDAPWIIPFIPVLDQGATGKYSPPACISLKEMPGTTAKQKLEYLVRTYCESDEGQWLLSRVRSHQNSGPCLSMAVSLVADIKANRKLLRCTATFFSGDTSQGRKHAWLEIYFDNEPSKIYVIDPTNDEGLVIAQEYYRKGEVYPRYWYRNGKLRPAIR